MKKIKFLAAVISVIMLAACSNSPAENTETVTTSEAIAETTSETEAETITETTTEQVTEEVPQTAEDEYVQVSPNNEFIDFEFIEDYQGVTDIVGTDLGRIADKAVDYLAVEFTEKTTVWESLYSEVPETVPTEFADYAARDGKIIPKFQAAYPNDYDGDGRTETFIVLTAPRFEYDVLQSYLVFADSSGNMELIDSFCRPYHVEFLNYGKDKQIVFGGEGEFGVESHCTLFGVKDGKAIVHYRLRGGFSKENCFLSSFGWQGSGALMYYDTVMREYRVIESTDVDIEDIRAMDKTGVFEEYYGEDSPFSAFRIVGGKYYCLIKNQMMDWGEPYIYENGEFIKLENSNIRVSYDFCGLPCVIDIDMDKAAAEMKPPVEPFVKVSPNNEFIDYEFIEDYQGTTDIGGLADKAVKFLKDSEYYAESMENISEFTDEKFAEYIRDGVIEPKLAAAYPADYDGDGNTETFIIIEMPYSPKGFRDGITAVRDFVVFSDKDGNMEIIDETSNIYPAVLLNYGGFKHIAIGGDGIAGVETHTVLYGVKDGKAVRYYGDRCRFAKEDCFLSVFGWQGRRDFMYFDTAAREYRVIVGVDVSIEDIRAMDTTNVLDELLEYDGTLLDIQLIGGKYYCIVQGYTDWGHVYTYDNGVFTLIENSNVLISPNLCELKEVVDIDIEQALASMKPVQK